jgi:hypothetical protein
MCLRRTRSMRQGENRWPRVAVLVIVVRLPVPSLNEVGYKGRANSSEYANDGHENRTPFGQAGVAVGDVDRDGCRDHHNLDRGGER